MDKKVHLELLRIIAIFLVMFNHTWIRGFSYFNSCVGTPWYWVYLFFSILVKIDVPLFFMISGALLLGKEESIGTLYRKRVLRAAIALVLFSFVSYLYLIYLGDVSEFRLKEFLIALYTGSISGHYWFMYRYIGFLMLLPILRVAVKHFTDIHYAYIVGLFLLVQAVKITEYAVSHGTVFYDGSFDLFILQDLITFPIVGYYIENKMPDERANSKTFYIMCIASFISVIISCIMTWYSCTIIGEWYESTCQTFFNNLILIPTATAYLGALLLFRNHQFNEKILSIIVFVGSTSFGVYLLEQIYRNETIDIYYDLLPYIGSYASSLIWITCAFMIGVAVTAVLKLIPGLKKII